MARKECPKDSTSKKLDRFFSSPNVSTTVTVINGTTSNRLDCHVPFPLQQCRHRHGDLTSTMSSIITAEQAYTRKDASGHFTAKVESSDISPQVYVFCHFFGILYAKKTTSLFCISLPIFNNPIKFCNITKIEQYGECLRKYLNFCHQAWKSDI